MGLPEDIYEKALAKDREITNAHDKLSKLAEERQKLEGLLVFAGDPDEYSWQFEQIESQTQELKNSMAANESGIISMVNDCLKDKDSFYIELKKFEDRFAEFYSATKGNLARIKQNIPGNLKAVEDANITLSGKILLYNKGLKENIWRVDSEPEGRVFKPFYDRFSIHQTFDRDLHKIKYGRNCNYTDTINAMEKTLDETKSEFANSRRAYALRQVRGIVEEKYKLLKTYAEQIKPSPEREERQRLLEEANKWYLEPESEGQPRTRPVSKLAPKH